MGLASVFSTTPVSSRIRKAFVLGAGMGTRLQPLTNLLPKPLLPIFGKPLITFAFDHLQRFGIREFIVNTHHLPEKISAVFEAGTYWEVPINLVFEPVRLGTGGGMKNIEDQIGDEVFLVYSGDILTDVPLEMLVAEHFMKKNDVTIALRTTGLSTSISWSPKSGQIVDILGKLNSSHVGRYDFAGISVWNPSVFSRLPSNESVSFIPLLSEWIQAGGKIGGVVMESNRWYNIGSRKEYLEVHRAIKIEGWSPGYVDHQTWPTTIEPSAQVASSSQIEGASYVGANCTVGPNVVLQNSILLAGSSVTAGTQLHSCVVGGVNVTHGTYWETDFV